MIRFAFLRGISKFGVKNALGAAIIKAEFLKLFFKPGKLVLNLGSWTLSPDSGDLG